MPERRGGVWRGEAVEGGMGREAGVGCGEEAEEAADPARSCNTVESERWAL